MLTTSQFTPVLTSTALRAKRAFDKHFFGIVARVHPPWWCGVLLGSYTITFGACFFFSSFTLPYDLFTNACVGSIFAFFLALQGMLGTISTLLIWRLLKILKIPSPVNVLLAVITSIFVAVVYHPFATIQLRQTGWEFFNLGVFPTLLGSIAAGLLIPSRTSGISETKLIKTDNDGVTPISYTES